MEIIQTSKRKTQVAPLNFSFVGQRQTNTDSGSSSFGNSSSSGHSTSRQKDRGGQKGPP